MLNEVMTSCIYDISLYQKTSRKLVGQSLQEIRHVSVVIPEPISMLLYIEKRASWSMTEKLQARYKAALINYV